MNLADFNPWWTQGKVPPPLCGKKRAIFSQIFKYIPLRQILIISGLRRVGKTTLGTSDKYEELLGWEKISVK